MKLKIVCYLQARFTQNMIIRVSFVNMQTNNRVQYNSARNSILLFFKAPAQHTQVLHAALAFNVLFILHYVLRSVHSSGNFIGRRRAMLVFYARYKSRAAFPEAFVRG